MKTKSLSKTTHIVAVVGFLGVILSQMTPAQAGCRSTQTIGSIDFGDCQSISFIGGENDISMKSYKIRQAAQMDLAIASYTNTFTANIAQWSVHRTMTVSKLKTGEFALLSVALENPSNSASADASLEAISLGSANRVAYKTSNMP